MRDLALLFLSRWVNAPPLVRVLAFFAIWGALWLPILVLLKTLFFRVDPLFPVSDRLKIPLLLSLYCLVPGLLGLYCSDSPWTFSDYGLIWGLEFGRSVLWGFGVGIASMALLFGMQTLSGGVRWRVSFGSFNPSASSPQVETAMPSLINVFFSTLLVGGLTLAISWVEELVFRGFVVTELLQAYPLAGVVLMASALFAALHLVWDGWAGIYSLPGLALMGAVLMLARWVDGGSLGLPTGLHAGWIFTLAWLDSLNIAEITDQAPVWLMGRKDQPLTSGLTLGLMGVVAVGLWLWSV